MPDGWHAVTPRIFARDTRRLVEWVKQVFQATGRYQTERPSEIQIGDSKLMIAGVGVRPPTPACLYVYVPSVDATYRRAVRAGARVLEKPLDTPYGDRRCMVADRWGNLWQIATRRR
jgi:uncharacterized glyoxalase superfamily protein PhnB